MPLPGSWLRWCCRWRWSSVGLVSRVVTVAIASWRTAQPSTPEITLRHDRAVGEPDRTRMACHTASTLAVVARYKTLDQRQRTAADLP
jgi:hypothetical protein